jgi:hypothetical protein
VDIAPGIVRDSTAIEHQLAAVAGRRRAHQDIGPVGRVEELDGMGSVLLWALSMRPEAPISGRTLRITKTVVLDEWAQAGSITLDLRSPARAFARGAHQALHWLIVLDDGDLLASP